MKRRDPLWAGLITLVAMPLAVLLVLRWDDLPLVGGGPQYTAWFREAAGIQSGDEVRVAGVKVGEVTAVELRDSHVDVRFRVRDVWLGDRTTAAIRIKTVLGSKNLVLDPLGGGELDPATPIPLDRTISPYDVNDALGDLARTTGAIDTRQLAESLRTLSSTMSATTPETVRSALDGLSSLSTTISSRDQELRDLLGNTRNLSGVVADRTDNLRELITNGNVLLAELNKRRDGITALLAGTRNLSEQLSGLVADNQAAIGPMLAELDRVTEVLRRNQESLDRGLRLAGPFYRLVGGAVDGKSGWLDTYVCGLIPRPGGGCAPPKPGGR